MKNRKEYWEAWVTMPDPHGGDDVAEEWLGNGHPTRKAALQACDPYVRDGWVAHVQPYPTNS